MTEAIVWGVLWLAFAFLGAWGIFAVGGFGGVALAAVTDKVWIAPIGAVVGWLGAIAWFLFSAVQVILQIISVVQIASAG